MKSTRMYAVRWPEIRFSAYHFGVYNRYCPKVTYDITRRTFCCICHCDEPKEKVTASETKQFHYY